MILYFLLKGVIILRIDDNSYIIGNNKSEEFIRTAYNSYFLFNIDKKQTISNNIELLNLYDSFIDKCAKLIKELKINNDSLSYTNTIGILINLGIFSNINNKFNYGIVNKEIKYFEGINIIKGEGVCRNFSAFTKDILDKLNIYAENVWCSTSTNLNKTSHTINIINYNNKYYGIDIYNNLLLSFINQTDLISLFNDNITFRLTLLKYLVYDGLSINDLQNKLSAFHNSTNIPPITSNNYESLIKEIYEIITDNNSLLYDFTIDTNNTKNKIIKIIK